jgi:threonine/homoserine efflux transporter RhtA
MCDGLYMLGPVSSTIRRCAPVGVVVALLECVCHCGYVL